MTPPAAPRLLTIAREIRDQIYSYLHKELQLRTDSSFDLSWRFDITVTGAPYLPILLVCSRLHDEYVEMNDFKNLSARVVLVRSSYYVHTSGYATRSQDLKALARISCATVGLKAKPIIRGLEPFVGTSIESLFYELPRLRTLRILEQSTVGLFSDARLPVLPSNIAFYNSTSHVAPSEQTRGLKLAQKCTGRTVGHGKTWSRNGRLHSVVEFSATVYVATAVDVDLWTHKEVLASLGPMGYPKQELRRLRHAKSDLLTVLPNKMLGWKEEMYL